MIVGLELGIYLCFDFVEWLLIVLLVEFVFCYNLFWFWFGIDFKRCFDCCLFMVCLGLFGALCLFGYLWHLLLVDCMFDLLACVTLCIDLLYCYLFCLFVLCYVCCLLALSCFIGLLVWIGYVYCWLTGGCLLGCLLYNWCFGLFTAGLV